MHRAPRVLPARPARLALPLLVALLGLAPAAQGLPSAPRAPAVEPAAAPGTPHPQGCAASQDPAALAAADAPGAALQARIDSVLPTPAEERFLAVPWRTNLMAARREAQAARKPIFLWIMVGNPQGCT